MFADEVKSGDRVILKVFENEAGVKIKLPGHGGSEKYFYDNTFGPECTQERLYQSAAKPIVDNVLKGMNCCIFAYGQTGTGGYACGTAPLHKHPHMCVCSALQRRVPGVQICVLSCVHAGALTRVHVLVYFLHFGPCVHVLTCVCTHVCLYGSVGVCTRVSGCPLCQSACVSKYPGTLVRLCAWHSRGIAHLSTSRAVAGAFMCVRAQARPTP